MNKTILANVKATYEEKFGAYELCVHAPGRINLIGEHTDYNNGFVLPAAVGQGIVFAIGKSGNATAGTLVALDLNESFEFDLNEIAPLPQNSWQNYVLGVVAELQKAGHVFEGFNLVFSGDVPRGSGMSSSAAMECGACFAINELFNLGVDKVQMVKHSQKAEHNYAGVMCGIMDQFASMMGSKDQALLLDCESLEFKHFPIALTKHTVVLCNSNVSHNLASSEYNVRRQQCEEGVAELQKLNPDILSLRQATLADLDEVKESISDVVYLRCKYVIEENERVIDFTEALSAGDLVKAGDLLKVAQVGMKDEYAITCPEIDFMADFANARKDVIGARMMGGGFGGCTINIVETDSLDEFLTTLGQSYQEKFGKAMTPIAVDIADGVRIVS